MSEELIKTPEEKQKEVGMGIDSEGFFCVKVHISLGKWNLLGILTEAQQFIFAYFLKVKQDETKKGLRGFGRWR